MTTPDKLIEKVQELIKEVPALTRNRNRVGQITDSSEIAQCKGWIAEAVHAVKLICPPMNAYRTHVEEISQYKGGFMIAEPVFQISGILERLVKDAKTGLLSALADELTAGTFDRFLDHAKSYLSNSQKMEAGVIAGVVFEDTIRRIAEKHSLSQKGEKLDDLISRLSSE